MNELNDKIRTLIRQDEDDVPLPSLNHLSNKLRGGRHRVTDAASMLLKQPKDPLLTELYLWELFATSMRQIGAEMCLGPTFVSRVKNIDKQTLDALTNRKALEAIAKLAPVAVVDPRLLAHALSIDGKLVKWLAASKPKKPKEDGQQVYRKLAAKYHPDREGGNAEVMAALNELYRSTKRTTA